MDNDSQICESLGDKMHSHSHLSTYSWHDKQVILDVRDCWNACLHHCRLVGLVMTFIHFTNGHSPLINICGKFHGDPSLSMGKCWPQMTLIQPLKWATFWCHSCLSTVPLPGESNIVDLSSLCPSTPVCP